MNRLALVAVATLLAFPIAGMSADKSWYAGVAGGASSLRPGTKNSPFKIDSSLSVGGGVFIGYDHSPRISFEGGYSYLGDATLSSANGKGDISYSALSAGALMYLYGDDMDIAERNGFIGYLRLGLNSMSNSSSPSIPLEKEDNTGIWAGVGVEWPLNHNLNLRGELTSFDGDAQTARLSVLFRPRAGTETPRGDDESEQQDAVLTQQVAEPEQLESESKQQETTPDSDIEQETPDAVQPSIAIADIACTAPASNEPIDARGCALFGGLLSGVEFASGTANLTPESASQLDSLGENLLRYNTILIEIQSHTESFGDLTRAKDIAKQRTIAIARQLVERGVPVSRLKARAFGHSSPLAPDNTDEGRQQNNRIELLVLP